MQTKFTTSTNIIRDGARDINYISTPNSLRVINQIVNDFKKGIRSFNIIGSYGTGKSSFLWAMEQSLLRKKKIFQVNLLPNPALEIINFVGEYKSLKEAVAEYFEIHQKKQTPETIFAEIFNRYHDLGKKNPLLILNIDEFGKFLEYAAQHSPEKELYFIQQLAEFVNNPDHNIVMITTAHQNFDAYAFGLTNLQRQEWTKVKGRFREIAFNEPVEQLLFLAAEHLMKPGHEKKRQVEIKSALDMAKKAKAFSINPEYSAEIAGKIFPLDILAANVLTLSLQKYGQNERSLFSFLESTDHTGIESFDKKENPFYNIACVYDYLLFNFYPFISSRYNPDFTTWAAIKGSLEAVERLFDGGISEYFKIVKTIGLLNVNAAGGAVLGKEFIVNYAKICLGIEHPERLIDDLTDKKIIVYKNYSKRYTLADATELDITSALIEAGNKVDEINDIATLLNRYYQLPPVTAKAYSYINGTPRLFEFRISEFPISEAPRNEIDGFINLIFNERLSLNEVKKESVVQEEAIIYGFYQNSKTIRYQLFEIEKTKKVIEENGHDLIAVKELNNILLHQKNLLNHYILNNLYAKKSDLKWIYKGQEVKISSKKEFNHWLSGICQETYPMTPVFKNELVNRHRISSSIHTAKRSYFRALVDHWNKEDLGFDPNKFPAEKTIYLTLLKENGVKLYSDDFDHMPQVSFASSFRPLWDYSLEFLEKTKKGKRPVTDLIEPLTRKPFKLKQGVIDFYIASFLFIKRDDYALFGESGYIPTITDEVLELIVKYPEEFEIKAFDIEGVKLDIFNSYRVFLNQHSKEKLKNQTFIETIKPFLTFYKGLSEYSRNTKRLKKETVALRKAIANAKDPEKSFFEDFPMALGYTEESLIQNKENLPVYILKLQDCIRELRTSYDHLLDRLEEFILTEFVGEQLSMEEYRERFQLRFKKLKKHLCLPHHIKFIQRLDSKIEDRNAWLSSIAQSVIDKPLENITDEDELVLFDKFKTLIAELDSLTNLVRADVDEEKEEVLGIEMSSFVDGIRRNLIRIPKTKYKEATKIEDSIRNQLSNDKAVNILALANLLKTLL